MVPEPIAPKILLLQLVLLYHGPHSPIQHKYALMQQMLKGPFGMICAQNQ
jgi:hypothetical protein